MEGEEENKTSWREERARAVARHELERSADPPVVRSSLTFRAGGLFRRNPWRPAREILTRDFDCNKVVDCRISPGKTRISESTSKRIGLFFICEGTDHGGERGPRGRSGEEACKA